MPKIVKYTVVAQDNVMTFQTTINSFLEMGYQPYGELVVDTNSTKHRYLQVMVKYES